MLPRVLILLAFSPLWCMAAEAIDPAPVTFDQAREAWLRDQVRSLTRRLILQEQVLTFRLEGIIEEGGRSGILGNLALEPLLSDDVPALITPVKAPDGAAHVAERLDYWMKRQQEVLAVKLAASGDIRRRLASTAAPDALQDMFRRDLKRAVAAYAAGQHGLAGALLQEILDLYPYVNLDDVRFYRAEAALADGAWDTAVEHYLVLLRTQPESAFRPQAFRHLVALRALFGQHATAVAECDEFSRDLAAAPGEVSYLCGREYFLAQRFRDALRLLEQVPAGDPVKIRARHLTGLCLILENRQTDAIALFEDLAAMSRRQRREDPANPAIREDARIKLGYLYFEAGQFQEAARMFEAVAKGGERYPEALLGKAWSGLSLSDHERALSLSRELVTHYPSSSYRYEAMTLAGYAAEELNSEESRRWYSQVMDEAERGESLRELALERRQMLHLLRRLVEMETSVFGEGRTDHFDEYLRLRGQSRVLMNRVKYTELQTANESMREYIDERRQIAQLARRLGTLLKSDYQEAAPAARQEMALLQRDVRRLMSRIRFSGLMEIQRQPLMIHERTLASANAMLDTLAVSSRIELNRLDGRLAELQPRGLESDPLQTLYRERYLRMEAGVEGLRSHAARLPRRPVMSNLPRWSELAFSRLAIGDIEFEELRRIEDRLRELDGYLESIGGLLEGGAGAANGGGGRP
ncbi:MAG: tetratricopeptide repeat protein [bacterium]|nr:tetratricopeptide repeat protein [bacterium]